MITATVTYSDPDNQTGALNAELKDTAGNVVTLTTPLTVFDPVSVSLSDTMGHQWIKISDDGSTAIFTATA